MYKYSYIYIYTSIFAQTRILNARYCAKMILLSTSSSDKRHSQERVRQVCANNSICVQSPNLQFMQNSFVQCLRCLAIFARMYANTFLIIIEI